MDPKSGVRNPKKNQGRVPKKSVGRVQLKIANPELLSQTGRACTSCKATLRVKKVPSTKTHRQSHSSEHTAEAVHVKFHGAITTDDKVLCITGSERSCCESLFTDAVLASALLLYCLLPVVAHCSAQHAKLIACYGQAQVLAMRSKAAFMRVRR